MPTPRAADLDADLGWSLGVVFRSYLKAVASVVDDLPGGPRGYQILASAVHDRADNQALLAQQLGIDRTVLTYLLDDLEQCGLVERRPDPQDRRRRRIVATDKGRTIWSQRHTALDHVEQHILAPLGPEAPTFRSLLAHLALHANESDPPPTTCETIDQIQRLTNPPTPTARARRRR